MKKTQTGSQPYTTILKTENEDEKISYSFLAENDTAAVELAINLNFKARDGREMFVHSITQDDEVRVITKQQALNLFKHKINDLEKEREKTQTKNYTAIFVLEFPFKATDDEEAWRRVHGIMEDSPKINGVAIREVDKDGTFIRNLMPTDESWEEAN